MIRNLKFYGILLGIVVAVGFFVARYLNNHSFVSDKFIKQKVDSISTLKKQIVLKDGQLSEKDTTIFRLRQELNMKDVQIKEQQIVQDGTNKRLQDCKNSSKQANEAIEHYEENGLMRFFVFDRQGLLKKGCYKEVFEKPKNICEQ